MTEHVEQLRIDWEAASLRAHCRDVGIVGVAVEILVYVLGHGDVIRVEGVQCGLVRLGKAGLAKAIRRHPSTVRDALVALEVRGLASRGVGRVLVNWDAVRALEAPDPVADLTLPVGWSGGGREVVGSSITRIESISTDSLTHSDSGSDSGESRETRVESCEQLRGPHVARAAYRVTRRDVVTPEGTLNRRGLVELYRRAVDEGFLPGADRVGEFAGLVALAHYVVEVGYKTLSSPWGWLKRAIERGQLDGWGHVRDRDREVAATCLARAGIRGVDLGERGAEDRRAGTPGSRHG